MSKRPMKDLALSFKDESGDGEPYGKVCIFKTTEEEHELFGDETRLQLDARTAEKLIQDSMAEIQDKGFSAKELGWMTLRQTEKLARKLGLRVNPF